MLCYVEFSLATSDQKQRELQQKTKGWGPWGSILEQLPECRGKWAPVSREQDQSISLDIVSTNTFRDFLLRVLATSHFSRSKWPLPGRETMSVPSLQGGSALEQPAMMIGQNHTTEIRPRRMHSSGRVGSS